MEYNARKAYNDWKKVSFTVNSTALLFHLIKKYL